MPGGPVAPVVAAAGADAQGKPKRKAAFAWTNETWEIAVKEGERQGLDFATGESVLDALNAGLVDEAAGVEPAAGDAVALGDAAPAAGVAAHGAGAAALSQRWWGDAAAMYAPSSRAVDIALQEGRDHDAIWNNNPRMHMVPEYVPEGGFRVPVNFRAVIREGQLNGTIGWDIYVAPPVTDDDTRPVGARDKSSTGGHVGNGKA